MMKILVAYDVSQCSESALDDLNRAGLPKTGQALLITVAEVWLPPPDGRNGDKSEWDPRIETVVKKFREKGQNLSNESTMLAEHAAARLRNILPAWQITTCITFGSPASEIISKAEDFQPDLIVLGSHGHAALSRLILGSISQKVLSESRFSVRISRGRNEVDPSFERIIIGYDGSPGSQAAITAVAARNWSRGAQVLLLSVADPIVPQSIGRFLSTKASWAEEESKSDHKWITGLAKTALKQLEPSRLSIEHRVIEGNPKEELIHQAENWHADCIFVGAAAHTSTLGRLLLGSTACAVAARAHCSVEAVRG
jgi:nucleotide-binding universal stress UspA family protein